MNLDFFELNVLEKELEQISAFHRIAFAASCCERLFPNYCVFAREEKWGNPSVLRNALDEIWDGLEKRTFDAAKISALIEDCLAEAPDSDDVAISAYDFEAQSVVAAICCTLKACLDPEPKLILKVEAPLGDTLFTGVELIEESKAPLAWDVKTLEDKFKIITSNPLSVREIAKQKEDLQRLKEAETLEPELLEWLRVTSHNNGKSLIDLS